MVGCGTPKMMINPCKSMQIDANHGVPGALPPATARRGPAPRAPSASLVQYRQLLSPGPKQAEITKRFHGGEPGACAASQLRTLQASSAPS